ncbi:MAG TPA: hypothetical protein VLB27_03915, partial [candidate division Zixibacteria bacterium]|nr:hypothetical protein [candidate division Zixibacteria bacterium]
ERMKQNNARVFALTALKSRLQILLVSEALDWDYRFIKNALASDERVEVTEVIEKAPGEYLGRKFPSSEAQLAEFDVIALHNPSRERSDGRYTALANAVRRGAGVFVFAGDRISGRAGSAKLIDSLLPAYPSSTSAITIRRPATIALRGENILHPTLRIAEGAERIRDSWSRFPPLKYLAPLNVVRPEAVTLAESEVGAVDLDAARISGGAPTPIICYHTLGRGKVLLFNGGPLWPMGFQGIDTERASERLRAFIAGGANWLSVSEELAPIRVTPERDVFARGERVGFSGTALDDGYQPLAGAEGEIQLYSADGADTLSATLEEIEPGVFQAEFSGVAPGVYRYDGRISAGGQALKSDTGRIQITEYSLEERETAPQFGALQSLADRTGGRYAHVSAVDNPRDLLPGEPIQVASAVDVSLRGLWPFLALFIAALAAEWVLRKRYQLL